MLYCQISFAVAGIASVDDTLVVLRLFVAWTVFFCGVFYIRYGIEVCCVLCWVD